MNCRINIKKSFLQSYQEWKVPFLYSNITTQNQKFEFNVQGKFYQIFAKEAIFYIENLLIEECVVIKVCSQRERLLSQSKGKNC